MSPILPALQNPGTDYIAAMRKLGQIFFIAVFIALVVALLVGVSGLVGFRLARLTAISKPHEENTSTVIRQVQSLADLVTVKYVVEKVVILDAPPQSTLGQFVQGDNRVLLLAHGIVKAGINLKNLQPGDVTISGRKIILHLPLPEITDAYLDDSQTKVIDWQRGFLRNFDKDLETTARQMAVDDIRRAARTDGILNEATQRAELQLAAFFQKGGFEQVEFTSQNPSALTPGNLELPKN